MKFRVERDVLADGVAWSARALPNRPSIPTLSGLLIAADEQDLTLSGFDLENAAQVHVDATVDEPGRVLVSGRLLADIARSLPNQPVVFATEGSRIELRIRQAIGGIGGRADFADRYVFHFFAVAI